LSVSHWESYYRGGAIAACPTGPEGTVTLELRDLWLEFFANVPDGRRVLDIGTGNGAVVLIAREAAARAGRQLDIHGADLARINPSRDVPDGARLFAGITFHPGVAVEDLPFEDARFAAVSGQYALEYTAMDTSLDEVLRVLEPGGAAQFLMHHAQSIVVERARSSLRQADVVMTETKIHRKLRRFREAEGRSPVSARRAWEELAASIATLQETARFEPDRRVIDVTLDAIPKLLDIRGKLAPAAWEREVDSVENELRDHVRRLKDLLEAALDDAGMERFIADVTSHGFADASCAPVKHGPGGVLVGSLVRMRKPT
jgi:ubiquinone/menaquinone biosynthesis C-methylase UbiE